jgi:putative oxidoreductase
MLQKLMRTDDDLAGLIARLGLGIVFLPHGLQKTLGLFGGYGFSGTMQFFTQQAHLPAFVAFLIILTESLGALSLIFGALGRVGALGVACLMVAAILLVHLPNGFFMNWFGNQKGEGFEYHLLAITLALVVLVKGSGRWSIDRALSK